jgi:YD repeat-containing protein
VAAESAPYKPGETPKWTTNVYDDLGRVLEVVKPDGVTTSYIYSGLVTLVETNDPKVLDSRQKSVTLKNAKGKVVAVWNPGNTPSSYTTTTVNGNASVKFKLDGFDRTRETNSLLKMNLGAYSSSNATYDALGNQITFSGYGKGKSIYVYDALGRLRRQTDEDGTFAVTTYDLLNRKIKCVITFASDSSVKTTEWYYYDTIDNEALHLVYKPKLAWIGALECETVTETGPSNKLHITPKFKHLIKHKRPPGDERTLSHDPSRLIA